MGPSRSTVGLGRGFFDWWMLLSKTIYMSKEEIARLAFAEGQQQEREVCGNLCALMVEVLLARRDDALALGNTAAALILARQAQTATDLADAIRERSNV